MASIYLDSCVLIAAFETRSDEGEAAKLLLGNLLSMPGTAVTSELTIAELLAPIARPAAMSIKERESLYLPLLDDGDFIELVPVSREMLMQMISLRAAYPQRIPDAIHMATAIVKGCRYFVSADRDARRMPASLTWVLPTLASVEAIFRDLNV